MEQVVMDLLRKDPADRPPSAVEAAVTARTPEGAPLPNATVRVDGESVGYTPQRLMRRAGQHTIRVEKEGYMPAGRTVLFEPDMETPLIFELPTRPE